jgi:hypothetical protein
VAFKQKVANVITPKDNGHGAALERTMTEKFLGSLRKVEPAKKEEADRR